MTPSPRSTPLRSPVARRFESARLHEQSIRAAYQVLVPVISRRPGRSRPIADPPADSTVRRPASTARGA